MDLLEREATLGGVIVVTGEHRIEGEASPSIFMQRYAELVERAETVDPRERFQHLPTFSADDIDAIPRDAFDFALKLGPGPTPAAVAGASRHGLWCFQHEFAGEFAPFLTEVYHARDVTAAALFALGAAGDDLVVLEQGWFGTDKRSYRGNRDRILASIAEWPARASRRIAPPGNNLGERPPGTTLTRRTHGQRMHLSALITRMAWQRVRFAWNRLFRHSQWNIGVLPVPIETLLHPGGYHDEEIRWFPLGNRQGFLADPFGVMRAGTLQILCEHYGYRSGKGTIRSLAYSDHGFSEQAVPAIEAATHLSYPFVVEDGGDVYCIPESSSANEIPLFRSTAFPRAWTKAGVLVNDFGGVDPTVFRHDGRWWLMATPRGREADTTLWIWHAPELAGPWTPHLRNPVKTDVRSARPGGALFVVDGVVYRPAQDCSRRYGWRIVIQRVTSLTPSEFLEEPVAVLEASRRSGFPLGRHTLTPVGDVVLIDGHRAVFVCSAFASLLGMLAAEVRKSVHRDARSR